MRGSGESSRSAMRSHGPAAQEVRASGLSMAGANWRSIAVPDWLAGLDFRDVHGFDDKVRMPALDRLRANSRGSTGPPTPARPGTLQHSTPDPKGSSSTPSPSGTPDHGLVLGDPVDGRFLILRTDDAGRTWGKIDPSEGMPEALPGEGAFAASGTCLVVHGDGNAWFGTGGGVLGPRLSIDGPRPDLDRRVDGDSRRSFPRRASSRSPSVMISHGVAVGGDYKAGDDSTRKRRDDRRRGPDLDSGRKESRPSGFRSAVAYVPDLNGFLPGHGRPFRRRPVDRRRPDLVETGRRGVPRSRPLALGRAGRVGPWAKMAGSPAWNRSSLEAR